MNGVYLPPYILQVIIALKLNIINKKMLSPLFSIFQTTNKTEGSYFV